MTKTSQINRLQKVATKYGIPNDLIDFQAEVDGGLTYEENLNLMTPKFEAFKQIEPDMKIQQKRHEYEEVTEIQETQERFRVEREATKLFNEDLRRIRTTPPNLEIYYKQLYELTESLVKSPNIHLLIIHGNAGTGKTENVKIALDRILKLKYEDKWVVWNTYLSPLELYNNLYENREKIIILDDVIKIFKDDISLSILLSGCWSPRIVNYHSTTSKLKVPKQFHFSGKLIIIVNEIPIRIQNVMSRAFHLDVNFDYQKLIKICYELCKIHNIDLEVADYIKKNTNPSFDIDLRLPFKINDIKNRFPENWKELARTQLDHCPILNWILENEDLPTKEAVKKFNECFGLSRATYFNYKKKLV